MPHHTPHIMDDAFEQKLNELEARYTAAEERLYVERPMIQKKFDAYNEAKKRYEAAKRDYEAALKALNEASQI